MTDQSQLDDDDNAFEQLLNALLSELFSKVSSSKQSFRVRKRATQYVLDEHHRPRPVPGILAWAAWMESHKSERTVGQTMLPNGLFVSTVFLGLDHNYSGSSPLLFETMIQRRDTWLDYQWRHSTWEQAAAAHRAIVRSFSADTPARGEDLAALDYPQYHVDPQSMRSDYASSIEYTRRRLGTQTQGNIATSGNGQIDTTNAEENTNRNN